MATRFAFPLELDGSILRFAAAELRRSLPTLPQRLPKLGVRMPRRQPLAELRRRTLIGQGDEVHLAVLNKNPVELRNGCLAGHRVQLLGEYHKGRSPNGQFFRQAVEYAGCGVRVLF